jgi:hypothetical protein
MPIHSATSLRAANRSAERVNLAERNGLHPGPFEPEAHASDSAEKVENAHHFHPPAR